MKLILICWLCPFTAAFYGKDVLPFIKDINRDMGYTCATIILENDETINDGIRDLMVEQDQMMIQVLEVKQMLNIYTDKKLERRCTFFILGDANAMLNHF